MAGTQQHAALSGLARCLVNEDLLTAEVAAEAALEAKRKDLSFPQYLADGNLVDSKKMAAAAAREFGLPLLDLTTVDMSLAPQDLVKEEQIRQHQVVPLFKRGNRLFLAVADPTQHQALSDIQFQTRLTTEAIVVPVDQLLSVAAILSEDVSDQMGDLLDEELGDIELGEESGDKTVGEKEESDAANEAPIVKFVNKVMLDAIKMGASDIHMEPYEKYYRIRYRQDGMLREISRPPLNIATRLTSRLKVMSRMNIAERRVPQDGRIKLKLSKTRSIDFRVNTCPTLYGEKICMRILDPTSADIGIEKLGFEPEQIEAFTKAIHRPYGMVLVTGPTGSGKTVSLYTGLNMLNKEDVNISTVEDPVEIPVAGINQVNQNSTTGLTFASALRAFLRQDPDIVMVGEIRDLETAEIAVKAAQTGHMVLSTLHTNDAPQTLTSLANMGV